MSINFFRHCDRLLKVLPSEVIMEPSKVAQYLNVPEPYALTVIERLRNDRLADGFGTGPVSRNMRTSVFPDFYIDEIKKIKDARRTSLYARWGFWLAVISTLWQIISLILGTE